MPRRNMKWAVAAAALAAAALAAVVSLNRGGGSAEATGDPSRGSVLYAENCASCHGKDLEGQPDWRSPGEEGVLPAPPHDRTGHTWHHGDGMLFEYTKLGGQEALEQMGVTGVASGMPGYAGILTDQEIWDILAFIKASWPEREQELQRQRTLSEQLKEN